MWAFRVAPKKRVLLVVLMCLVRDVVSLEDKCDPCLDRRWLFVVATGRSGSTTLLDMLNAVPQILMAGENPFLLRQLDVFSTAHAARRRLEPQPGASGGAWWHPAIDLTDEVCDIQELTKDSIGLKAVEPPTRAYVGFKEIRFTADLVTRMADFVFPCAKFIFNYRLDLEAQSASQLKHFQGHSQSGHLLNLTDDLAAWQNSSEEHKSKAFSLPLEHFDVDHFNDLLTWLGITGCNYTKVLHANNGGYNAPSKWALPLDDDSACRFIGP